MSITEPLPAGVYGKADWVDYTNYWREADAEWMQKRIVTRYADAASRTTAWPTPEFGQITYNEQSLPLGGGVYADRPEMYSKQHNAWVPLLMLLNITSTQDNTAGVALSHKNAGGKGVIFQPAQTVMDNPIQVMGGVLYVDATGASIKTGAKTAKLTTDATSLVSDSPLSAPGITLTGAGTLNAAGKVVTVGALTADSLSTAGALTAATATIGGVSIGATANMVVASAGFVANNGFFSGDGGSALMRQRNPSTGVVNPNYLQIGNDLTVGPANSTASFYMYAFLRIMQGKGIAWHAANGVHTAWISPVIYSGGDPGAGNYPDGTLWIS